MGFINSKFFLDVISSSPNEHKVKGWEQVKNDEETTDWNKLISWKLIEQPKYEYRPFVKLFRIAFATVSHPITFLFINIFIAVIIQNGENDEGYESLANGISGVYAMLLSLMFTQQQTRYKDSHEHYDALCGDIKAFAVWLACLSRDHVKYNYKKDATEAKQDLVQVENKKVDDTFEKMRMILAVLAPVAKHVIRYANSENDILQLGEKPDPRRLDDKYRLVRQEQMCCRTTFIETSKLKLFCKDCKEEKRPFVRSYLFLRTSKENNSRHIQWSNFQKKNYSYEQYLLDKENMTSDDLYKKYSLYDFYSWGSPGQSCDLKRELYGKVADIYEKTETNLFETLMQCLLDYVNEMNELSLGIEDGNERDLITKWNHIYGSYGKLMSFNTYAQPLIIRVVLVISLFCYTYLIRIWKLKESVWMTIFTVLPILLLWIMTNLLYSPFKKRTFFLVQNVSRVGRDTQREVNNIISQRKYYDLRDIYRRSKLKFIEKDSDVEKSVPQQVDKIRVIGLSKNDQPNTPNPKRRNNAGSTRTVKRKTAVNTNPTQVFNIDF